MLEFGLLFAGQLTPRRHRNLGTDENKIEPAGSDLTRNPCPDAESGPLAVRVRLGGNKTSAAAHDARPFSIDLKSADVISLDERRPTLEELSVSHAR